MATYLAAETGRVVDLRDPDARRRLQDYLPLIQPGRAAEQLLGR